MRKRVVVGLRLFLMTLKKKRNKQKTLEKGHGIDPTGSTGADLRHSLGRGQRQGPKGDYQGD